MPKARASAPGRRTRISSASAVAAAGRGGDDDTVELGRRRGARVVDEASVEERAGMDEAAGRGADMLGGQGVGVMSADHFAKEQELAAREQALAAKEAALAAKLKDLAATFILTARHLEGGVRMCVWVYACACGHILHSPWHPLPQICATDTRPRRLQAT